jgi:hypothetical protein
MVEATGLKLPQSQSPPIATPPDKKSLKLINWLKIIGGTGTERLVILQVSFTFSECKLTTRFNIVQF